MTTRSHPPKPPPPNEPRTPAGNHPDSLPLPPPPPPPISSPPAPTLNSNPHLPTTAWRPLSPSFRACSRRCRRFPARFDEEEGRRKKEENPPAISVAPIAVAISDSFGWVGFLRSSRFYLCFVYGYLYFV
ncbi:hypothetical protein GBA52_014107 [Prunus armeniaca]|nr:hypothetical protein GBA52_014107 [Prunus armeniaca]